MGKVIGGGLPAAAYGGPRELMERIAPAGDVYQAGTLCGQPARRRRRPGDAAAARRGGLRAPGGARPSALGRRACARPPGDRAGAGRRAPRACSPSSSPTEPVRDYAGARRCDLDAYARLVPRRCSARGVYPPPSQFEAWFPSLAHDAEHVERTRRGRGRGVRGGRAERRSRDGSRGALRGRGRPAGRRRWRAGAGAATARSGAAAAAGPRAAGREPTYALRRRGDPRGLPAALRRRPRLLAARRPRPRAAGRRPALRARPRAPGRARRPRGGRRAGRRDLAVRAGPRRGRPGAGRRRLAAGAARSAGARRRARPRRRRARRRRRGRSRRCVTSVARSADAARSRVDSVRAPHGRRRRKSQVASTPPTAASRAPSRARRSRAGAS